MSGNSEDNISNEVAAKNDSNDITDSVFDETVDERSLLNRAVWIRLR